MTTGAGVTDGGGQGYADDDRLPWLESADDDYREHPSILRVIALILIALAVVAVAVVGYTYYKSHQRLVGTGELINAQDGDYKVKPDEVGGMKVDGEGDSVFATSEGSAANGSINTRAVPEAPVDGTRAPPKPATGPGAAKVVAPVPPSGGSLTSKAAAIGAIAPVTGGGALVQLGSFPSEGGANAAWAALSKRLSYVADLGKSVEKAEVGGRTVYRLRVNAGSAGAAQALCGKLKVAGEACFIPN